MSQTAKLKGFMLAVLAAGTFLGLVLGSIAFYENLGDRSLGAMLVVWGLALAISAVGCVLFAVASFLLFKRISLFRSTYGFVGTGAIFGAVLGALWVLRHHLLFGVQPSQFLIWSILGALTGFVAAIVFRRFQRQQVRAASDA